MTLTTSAIEARRDLPIVLLPLHPPTLARVDRDGRCEPIATISASRDATIVRSDDRVLVHDPATARIELLRATGNGLTLERTFRAPPDIRIRDIALDAHRVFAGGSDDRGAVLFSTDRTRDAPWTALALPESLAISGKAIDGLFVDGERARLVALDDIVFPHAMLRYDLQDADAAAPRLVDETELPGRTYEEHAPGIVANDRWLATRSTSVGEMGTAAFVDLLDRETLAPTATIWRGRDWDRTEKDIAFRGIGFVGTKLLIAAGDEGVGVFDTKGLRRRTRPFTWPGETRDVTKRVAWRPTSEGSAVDVVPVSQWGGALVIVERGEGRGVEWIRA